MFRSVLFSALFAFFTAAVFVQKAGATSIVRFAFDSLCVRAETIAHVRCVESQSFRDAERGGVFTRTRLEVLSPVKGDPGGEIVLILPGGSVDSQRVAVLGIPGFVPGEETVVFLSGPDDFGSPWPIGLGQGCYSVQAEEGKGPYVFLRTGVNPFPDGPLFKPAPNRRTLRIPLQGFLNRIRQTLPPPLDER